DGGGYYDRFRDRIMFPINDVHGNVVGFTGRILHDNPEAGGKYVNTPQTIVFDKGRIIYALDKAKQEARKQDKFIIVEGQMDVAASHQFGLTNTVASSGTALTRDQIKLLKRFTNNVYIAFDVDTAGQNATARGIELALLEGMKIKIVTIAKYFAKDADECLKKDPAVWQKAVDGAQSIMDYFFSSILAGQNLNDPEVRGKISTALLEKIKQLPDAVEQDFWIKKLASILDIKYEILYEKMRAFKGLPPTPEKTKMPSQVEDKKGKERLGAEKLLAIILHWPVFLKTTIDTLNAKAILSPELSSLYESLVLFYNTAEVPKSDFEVLIHSFKAWNGQEGVCQMVDILGLLYDKEYSNLSQKEAAEELLLLTNGLNLWYNGNIRRNIEEEMRQAEKMGDKEKIKSLMQTFKDLL
ncbi:MAG: toprim domain-containing protein, partial [Candidatus Magasanikbacteria bacterium]|nr:toprim domain-containing protein [Candidatus Magasanikbacteria bacterium]